MRALEKGLYVCEFNGRLTSVTVTRVDDLVYAYDTRCQTTKALLAAIVKEFNMSRKRGDFFFWADVFVLHPKLCSSVNNLRLHLLVRWNCVDLSDLPKPCRQAANTENIAVCWDNSNGCNFNHVQICHTK